jgi:Spy/CpxP family protein refolding chaperone
MPLDYLKANLALKAEQEPKIKEIQEQYRKDMREAMQGGISADSATKLRELGKKANEGITALLTEEQKKKAPEVIKEAQAFLQVGMRLEALMVLKLTEDQKKKFLEIGDKAQKEMADLPREERRTKGREIRQRVTEEASKLLTEEQKKALEKFNEENPVRRRQNGNGNNNPNA